ncbi:MAG: hypothetical protein HY735_00145 [Verrucomicrobia bacterium]|nr:hypothetical protein [Verrucomicrobiota bacterium]
MTPEEKIEPAIGKIEQLLVEHCANGAQTRDLKPDGAACGQFVGPTAKERPQRGLHGTAAALRVLAEGNLTEANSLVPKLVWYIQNREKLHNDGKEPTAGKHAFDDDQKNVIKLSEVLYALSFVNPSQCSTDSMVQELANKLLAARKENKGWTYFLDTNAPIDNLPTAFAILALCQHGYEPQIRSQIEFLEANTLDAPGNQTTNVTETSVKIFCVFALTFRKENLTQNDVSRRKLAFAKLWRTHQSLFDQDLEQNIEYWNGPNNYYVRIPWQLYLLALAARLDPWRISSLRAQRRLDQILDAVLQTGFCYPYTGPSLSSRTNAILFDVLQKIKRFSKRNFFHALYYAFDAVRTFLSHPFFSGLTLTGFLLVAGYFIYAWATRSGKPEDVGPDLTGAMILLLISFFFERLRKSR